MKDDKKQLAFKLFEYERLKNQKVRQEDRITIKDNKDIVISDRMSRLLSEIKKYINYKARGIKVTISECARLAGVSERTFNRKMKMYKDLGKFVEHGNKNREPHNKIDPDQIIEILERFDNYIEQIDKYHGRKIYMSVKVVYYYLVKAYRKEGREIPVSLKTFYRYVTKEYRSFVSKYSDKKTRRKIKKLTKLWRNMEELKKNIKNQSIELEKKAIDRKVMRFDEQTKKPERKVSIRRSMGEPGIIIQADGSRDYTHGGTEMTRMQAIDQKTLYTMGIAMVENENNKGYISLLSQIVDDFGIPDILNTDRRKGVDPADEGALVALACSFLGITIVAISDSTHKAELEKLNGPMHGLVAAFGMDKGLKTPKDFNDHIEELKEETNTYFNYPKENFAKMKPATEMQKKILKMDLKQHQIKSLDGIVIGKKVFTGIDDKGVPIVLTRPDWSIVASKNKKPKYLWIKSGIYRLKEVTNELDKSKAKLLATAFDKTKKSMFNNGVMIMNLETTEFLLDYSKQEGIKEANKSKLYQLNEQYKELLDKKRKLSELVNELENETNR